MINNKRSGGNTAVRTLADTIFNIVITALAVTFVILMSVFIKKVRAYSDLVFIDEPEYILSNLNRGNYYSAVVETNENRGRGVYGAEYEVPYALGDYYRAAFYEKAYRENGDIAKADELAAKMQDYRKKAGDLEMIADEMDELLNE